MSIKPKIIMDYGKLMTKVTKRRKTNLIRKLTETHMKNPGSIFFASGMPNPTLFPFREITVTFNDGTHKKLTGNHLSTALQYGPSQGHFPLIQKWREFQQKWHSPKCNNWDVHFTSGSMEGCSKLFEMLIEEGDPILVQSPTYPGVLNSLLPLEPDFIPVGMDEEGVLPDEVTRACEDRLSSGRPPPKLLYVNPTGANPVGTVFSTRRKLELYQLARRFGMLIIEDDAYYFVHFLPEQPTSFLSLDEDGRVLRLDSFSKFLSAGLRLGAVTGPKPILDKLNLHVGSSTLHPSSLSQVLVHQLLTSWSEAQLLTHFQALRAFYRAKRDLTLAVLQRHFTGIAEWSEPRGGMFVWLRILGMDDVYEFATSRCAEHGVILLPGHAFYPDESRACSYVRICYSQASDEDITEGLAKVAALIKEATK